MDAYSRRYVGTDTKIVRNARDAPSKLSAMEKVVNSMVMFILGCMVALTTVSVVVYSVWNNNNKAHLWSVTTELTPLPTLLSIGLIDRSIGRRRRRNGGGGCETTTTADDVLQSRVKGHTCAPL